MITVKSGHSVGYLTGPVSQGREGYYTGAVAAGEPPGVWYGAGAEVLGLAGQVDADVMEAIYSRLQDPRAGDGETLAAAHRKFRTGEEHYQEMLAQHPGATPEQRAELRADAERKARQAVAFEDATFSPVKSVTVLCVAFERMENDARKAGDERAAEAWGAHRRAVEAAVMAGARASIDFLQDAAGYTRVGDHAKKSGRWMDAHRFVVAQFLQHDSREKDPQLHVHQAILNLTHAADGHWGRLDGTAIRQQSHAAGAIGARVMEAELSRTIGVRFEAREDGTREVAGVPQAVMDLFSKRSRALGKRAEELARAYRDQHGREPSLLERAYIRQQATLETRAKKSHTGETLEERLDRWERECRETLTGGLAQVARTALQASPAEAGEPARLSDTDVIERAIAAVSDKRGNWRRPDLMRAISEALPANLGVPADKVRSRLEALTDAALERAMRITPAEDTSKLPAELLLANREPVYSRPGSAYYTAEGTIKADRMRRDAAVERGAVALSADQADAVIRRYAENGVKLGDDQKSAVLGVLTSGARVTVLVAPAGAGKSFTVGPIADEWARHGRFVHGLAPSQAAADVVAEAGVAAWNTKRWLNAQERGGRGDGAPPALQAGDLVVVDESGMASTPDVGAIIQRVRAADAKLLLVLDHRQLAAVGAGGAAADIAERAERYELTEVRRFREQWEREASLRLRDGDAAVLDVYDKAGRLSACGTPEQAAADAARRWLADTMQGRQSLLIVGSNENAGAVSGHLRAELVRLGRVAEHGVPLGLDGNIAGVGDVVEARHNAWDLKGWAQNERAPVNRETYRVLAHRADGGLSVEHTRSGTRVELPADYVSEHLNLAYAATVNAAQGRTVDTAHAVVGPGANGGALYVSLTRGRESNTAYVVTQPTHSDAPVGSAQDVEERSPRAVLADILERERTDRTALAEQEAQAEEAASTATVLERLSYEAHVATAGRTSALLDTAAATGVITDEQRVALAADPAMGSLERLLRQAEVAGHDPAVVLARALQGRSLDDAAAPGSVLFHRIRETVDMSVRLETAHQLIPRGIDEAWRALLEARADAADERRRELGARAAEDPPPWAVEVLGPVPDDPIARAEWEHRAGWAAAHRELVGHDDATDPLGSAPPAGLPEKHAHWRTAHLELDLPDRGPDEAKLTTGQLRVRVTAWERAREIAPKWVGDMLAATSERLAEVRADAALWAVRARDQVDMPAEEREQLQEAAEKAEREAEQLEQRVDQLREADKARAEWYLANAPVQDAGERARAEIAARGVDLDGEPKVTFEEWYAAHRAERVEDEKTRQVTPVDVDETPADAPEVLATADAERVDEPVETALPNVRDLIQADVEEFGDVEELPSRRVATDDEAAEAVERAREVLLHEHDRQAYEATHEHDDGDDDAGGEELAQWAQAAAADVDEDVEVLA